MGGFMMLVGLLIIVVALVLMFSSQTKTVKIIERYTVNKLFGTEFCLVIELEGKTKTVIAENRKIFEKLFAGKTYSIRLADNHVKDIYSEIEG